MFTNMTMKNVFFNNPNPDCKEDCRFRECGPAMTTAAYYPPTYDKYGNNLNPDGNITTQQIACTVCGKVWQSATQYGKTTYTRIL
jgi:hypothetical protein